MLGENLNIQTLADGTTVVTLESLIAMLMVAEAKFNATIDIISPDDREALITTIAAAETISLLGERTSRDLLSVGWSPVEVVQMISAVNNQVLGEVVSRLVGPEGIPDDLSGLE